MITAIQPTDKEYIPDYEQYGVTKFIGKNGDGYRGVIVANSGFKARVFVLNGEKTGKIIEVEEIDPKQWPVEA